MDLLFNLPTKIFFKCAMSLMMGGITGATASAGGPCRPNEIRQGGEPCGRRQSRAACDRQGAGAEENAADIAKITLPEAVGPRSRSPDDRADRRGDPGISSAQASIFTNSEPAGDEHRFFASSRQEGRRPPGACDPLGRFLLARALRGELPDDAALLTHQGVVSVNLAGKSRPAASEMFQSLGFSLALR
jgi:hypothetical protein